MLHLLQRKTAVEVSEAAQTAVGAAAPPQDLGSSPKLLWLIFAPWCGSCPSAACFDFPAAPLGFPFRLQQQGQDSSFPKPVIVPRSLLDGCCAWFCMAALL